MFLRQAILHGGIPFELKIPKYNEVTLSALADMEQSKGKGIRGKNVRDAFADLKTDGGDDIEIDESDYSAPYILKKVVLPSRSAK
jgi:hypothetical protein